MSDYIEIGNDKAVRLDEYQGTTKTCKKCLIPKERSDYNISSTNKDRLRGTCKACLKVEHALWNANNVERIRETIKKWDTLHPGVRAERQKKAIKENPAPYKNSQKKWYGKNKSKVSAYSREYYAKNKEAKAATSHAWYLRNKEKAIENGRKTGAKLRSTLKGSLNNSMSAAINRSLRQGVKAGRHWEDLVGFSLEQLKKHIEKQFKPGMSWENYGFWHIDHKVPISVHNYATTEDIDFKNCWRLKNLQPLWAKDNLAKQGRINRPFQPSLLIS
jgi:hypothetical protein